MLLLKLKAAKAYLFPNSEFSGADWDTENFGDIFWEESMVVSYPERSVQ